MKRKLLILLAVIALMIASLSFTGCDLLSALQSNSGSTSEDGTPIDPPQESLPHESTPSEIISTDPHPQSSQYDETHMGIFTDTVPPESSFDGPGTETVPPETPDKNDPEETTPDEDTPCDIGSMIAALEAEANARLMLRNIAIEELESDYRAKIANPDPSAGISIDTLKKELDERISTVKNVYEKSVYGLLSFAAELRKIDENSKDVSEAQIERFNMLMAECEHNFGNFTIHGSNDGNTPCTERKRYSICSDCNEIKYRVAEHKWENELSSNKTHHWIACSVCPELQSLEKHVKDENGKCKVCGYIYTTELLIIESVKGESAALVGMIDPKYSVTVILASDTAAMPSSVSDLGAYDEVILLNVANRDLPDGFDSLLNSYVKKMGGSLLTIGGSKGSGNERHPNAYTREDMYGTLYQEMLPVEIIDYTSPTAVIVIIDSSGSMGSESATSDSPLTAAKAGALAALDGLTSSDYFGVFTFDNHVNEILAPTSCSNKKDILSALEKLPTTGSGQSVSLAEALEQAGHRLDSLENVGNKHVIIITDGELSNDDGRCEMMLTATAKKGISVSVVGMNCSQYTQMSIQKTLNKTMGTDMSKFINLTDIYNIATVMGEIVSELGAKEAHFNEFVPTFKEGHAVMNGVNADDMPTLGGFYASVLKEGAEGVLMHNDVPIYARWKYGNGKVGSFMCDLGGFWSKDFVSSEVGRKIINNIIEELL